VRWLVHPLALSLRHAMRRLLLVRLAVAASASAAAAQSIAATTAVTEAALAASAATSVAAATARAATASLTAAASVAAANSQQMRAPPVCARLRVESLAAVATSHASARTSAAASNAGRHGGRSDLACGWRHGLSRCRGRRGSPDGRGDWPQATAEATDANTEPDRRRRGSPY
jgi:hypothetical protein